MLVNRQHISKFYNSNAGGIPWQCSGQDPALPLQGGMVRSLVGPVRPHMLRDTARKLKKRETVLSKNYLND